MPRSHTRLGTILLAIIAVDDGGADASAAATSADRLGADLVLVGTPSGSDLPSAAERAAGAGVAILPAPGRVAVDAVHLALEHGADLLMVGRNAMAADPALLRDLLFRARLPVLVAGTLPAGPGPVVMALDGDPRGAGIVVAAASLARKWRRGLVAVAADPPGDDGIVLPSVRALRASRLVDSVAEAMPGTLPPGRPTIEACSGPTTAVAIAHAAADRDAACLVLGRRTGTSAAGTAAGVLAQWPGPALLVPI